MIMTVDKKMDATEARDILQGIERKLSNYDAKHPFCVDLPYGSVYLSTHYKLVKQIADSVSDNFLRGYAYRTIGEIGKANELFSIQSDDLARINSAICWVRVGNYKEALLALEHARESEANNYWRARALRGLGEMRDADRIFREERFSTFWPALIEQVRMGLLNDFPLISGNFFALREFFLRSLDPEVAQLLVKRYRPLLEQDYHLLLKVAVATNDFNRAWSFLSTLTFTPEVVATLCATDAILGNGKWCERLYSDRLIIRDQFEIKEEWISLALEYPHMISDFNTSRLNGRSYSINLAYDGSPFGRLEAKFRDAMSTVKLPLPFVKPFSLWFDTSISIGPSNIFSHMHTAGEGNSYYYTGVVYAQIPPTMLDDEGNLTFGLLPGLEKSLLTYRLRPQNGDVVWFPSWYFHESTPSHSSSPRVTFNFDVMSKAISLKSFLSLAAL